MNAIHLIQEPCKYGGDGLAVGTHSAKSTLLPMRKKPEGGQGAAPRRKSRKQSDELSSSFEKSILGVGEG